MHTIIHYIQLWIVQCCTLPNTRQQLLYCCMVLFYRKDFCCLKQLFALAWSHQQCQCPSVDLNLVLTLFKNVFETYLTVPKRVNCQIPEHSVDQLLVQSETEFNVNGDETNSYYLVIVFVSVFLRLKVSCHLSRWSRNRVRVEELFSVILEDNLLW